MKIDNSQKLIDLYALAEGALDKIKCDQGWWEYPEEIHHFIDEIASSEWIDYEYNASRELAKFRDEQYMQNATEDEICSILTAFIRGERFCEGFIGNSFNKAYVKNTISRLAVINNLKNI